MCLVLILLLLRPRLIIYNMPADQLRPILANLASDLDVEARWAGDSLALPKLGVNLHLETFGAMRNVSLVSVGAKQSHTGWRRLEAALAVALSREEVPRNPRGISLVSAGVLISVLLILAIARDPQTVAQALLDMLRIY
jgi:hypothetical protein